MFQTTPSTNSPVQYRTTQNYAQTFSGPIKQDPFTQESARRDSMAKAAFAGDVRGYTGQMGKGIRAGSKMADYRAGLAADAEAGKAYAQGQQDWLNLLSENKGADLAFQERQAGEQGWLRDLLLDRDNVQNRERMAAYKRKVDWELAAYKRRVEEQLAKEKEEEIMSSAFF